MRLTNLRPMLEASDLRETIRFYTEVLGFTRQAVYPDAESMIWASLTKDDIDLMFTARNDHSTSAEPTLTGSLYFATDSVDEIWEALKDRGALEYPIENFPYGMREFAIRECNGYLLQFGQEIPPSEARSCSQ